MAFSRSLFPPHQARCTCCGRAGWLSLQHISGRPDDRLRLDFLDPGFDRLPRLPVLSRRGFLAVSHVLEFRDFSTVRLDPRVVVV